MYRTGEVPRFAGLTKREPVRRARPSGLSTPADGDYFAPGKSSFMINYRVADLHGLLQALRSEGCNVLEKTDDSEYGKFGWVIDPEGNKIELWQPPDGQ